MGSDAAIVAAATWTAAVVAPYLVIRSIAAALRVRPGAARVAVGAGLATALALAGAGAAVATAGGGGTSRPPAVSADWPTGRPLGHAPAVTVRRGDCLWDIAARRLAHPTSAH